MKDAIFSFDLYQILKSSGDYAKKMNHKELDIAHFLNCFAETYTSELNDFFEINENAYENFKIEINNIINNLKKGETKKTISITEEFEEVLKSSIAGVRNKNLDKIRPTFLFYHIFTSNIFWHKKMFSLGIREAKIEKYLEPETYNTPITAPLVTYIFFLLRLHKTKIIIFSIIALFFVYNIKTNNSNKNPKSDLKIMDEQLRFSLQNNKEIFKKYGKINAMEFSNFIITKNNRTNKFDTLHFNCILNNIQTFEGKFNLQTKEVFLNNEKY